MSTIETLLANHLGKKHFGSILDVGCGTKPYQKLFQYDEYIGIDVEVSGRVQENKHADMYYDGINIPTQSDRFDLVLCTQVLEHVVDPDALVKEFNRVLKPGGTLVITVPFMWGEHEIPFDFRRYSSYGIKGLLTKSGFTIVTFQRVGAGLEAIQTLFYSEVNALRLPDTFSWRVKNRIIRFCWQALRFLLGKHELQRVYLDNFLIADKSVG